MTREGCCGTASAFVKVSAFLLLFAFILVLLGFAMPMWSTRDDQIEGLWDRCTGSECVSVSSDPLGGQGWFVFVQVDVTIGLILTMLDVILTFIMMYDAVCSGQKAIRIAAVILAFASAGFLLVGCLVYGIRGRLHFTIFYLGFSWGITLTPVFVLVVAGILLAVDIDRSNPVYSEAAVYT
ncbi:uncharacterized protein [Haliotis asinina]|uniref:uncharacterized protein n=1 Tax=Haliotis asinina TaxID=109174 RepID=UPI003532432E